MRWHFYAGRLLPPLDAAEAARRQKQAARVEAEQKKQQAAYRQRAIAAARKIWSAADDQPVQVAAYLAARGIDTADSPNIPRHLRWISDHPYFKRVNGKVVKVHSGPCLIAPISNAANQVTAVHQTWVDLDHPSCKAQITHNREAQPAKLVRGSKKAGAIRLFTPKAATVLVMGEGIETTLSAACAR